MLDIAKKNSIMGLDSEFCSRNFGVARGDRTFTKG